MLPFAKCTNSTDINGNDGSKLSNAKAACQSLLILCFISAILFIPKNKLLSSCYFRHRVNGLSALQAKIVSFLVLIVEN